MTSTLVSRVDIVIIATPTRATTHVQRALAARLRRQEVVVPLRRALRRVQHYELSVLEHEPVADTLVVRFVVHPV
jgi:predicted dinucleotide-binding enzyme